MFVEGILSTIQGGSYLAVFISSFILNSTTVLIPIIPIPTYIPILLGVGAGLNPLFVGLVAGLGSALGDLISYFVGFGGSAVLVKFEHKTPQFLKRFERFYSNVGFVTVFVFAILPLPFDVVGIISGVSQYDIKKFFAALLLGKTIRSVLIAYGASIAIPFLLHLS